MRDPGRVRELAANSHVIVVALQPHTHGRVFNRRPFAQLLQGNEQRRLSRGGDRAGTWYAPDAESRRPSAILALRLVGAIFRCRGRPVRSRLPPVDLEGDALRQFLLSACLTQSWSRASSLSCESMWSVALRRVGRISGLESFVRRPDDFAAQYRR